MYTKSVVIQNGKINILVHHCGLYYTTEVILGQGKCKNTFSNPMQCPQPALPYCACCQDQYALIEQSLGEDDTSLTCVQLRIPKFLYK